MVSETLKLWLDDLRPPPDESWYWVKSAERTIGLLKGFTIDELSLDNDLGEDQEEGRKVVRWMAARNCWPTQAVHVHTDNSVARAYMLGMVERYGPYA